MLAVLLASATALRAGATGDVAWVSVAAVAGCTQEDRPALTIELRPALAAGAFPRITIEIESAGLARAAGLDIPLLALSQRRAAADVPIARAALEREPGAASWLSGTVRVDPLSGEGRVAGAFDLTLPGGALKGSFDLPRPLDAALCG